LYSESLITTHPALPPKYLAFAHQPRTSVVLSVEAVVDQAEIERLYSATLSDPPTLSAPDRIDRVFKGDPR